MCRTFATSGSELAPGAPPRALVVALAICLFIVSFAIILATAFAFYCGRRRDRTGSESEYSARAALPGSGARGRDPFPVETTLPAFAYARDQPDEHGGAAARECAVCLGAVQEGEMVRRLPVCAHVYHVGCIDRWLAAHRTCPLCRSELDPCKMGSEDTLPPVQEDPPDQPSV